MRPISTLGIAIGVIVFEIAHRRASHHGLHNAEDSPHKTDSQYRSAVILLIGAILTLIPYAGLRQATVVNWTPPRDFALSVGGRPTPPFVDVDAGTFYLPVAPLMPEIVKSELESKKLMPNYQISPIHYMLTHEPQRLIDIIEAHAGGALFATTCLFLTMHLIILVLTAAGLGMAYSLSSVIGESVSTH